MSLDSTSNCLDIKETTPIQKFYEGKTIFLTGATGFIGKVVLEKLLRCCPGISCIYIMMREKKGKTVDQRMEQLFEAELFSVLKKQYPDFRNKVSAVYGNLSDPLLGISEQDRLKLKNEVNIIFHTAARVRWDDALRDHVREHIIATNTLLDMAKDFKNIEAYVHVSTAYVHRDSDFTVPEYVAKKHVTPKQIIDALEWMDDTTVNSIIPHLIKDTHITYVLVKALTENIVEDNHGHIPAAIVRPCYTTQTYKDPFPGWCDTIQGAQGITLAIAKGFLRAVYIMPNLNMYLIPVDVLINTLITTAWHIATTKPSEKVLVLNCIPEHGKLGATLTAEYLKLVISKFDTYMLSNIYRYPSLILHSSKFWYRIHAFFDHYIPAVIIDPLLYICTGKPIMLSLYKKMEHILNVYMKIGEDPWFYKMENYHRVQERLSTEDAKMFFMDTSDFDAEKYMDESFPLFRSVIAKEDSSNIPYARRKAKVWWFVTSFLKWAFIVCILHCGYSCLFQSRL